jgi:hypothetical protein
MWHLKPVRTLKIGQKWPILGVPGEGGLGDPLGGLRGVLRVFWGVWGTPWAPRGSQGAPLEGLPLIGGPPGAVGDPPEGVPGRTHFGPLFSPFGPRGPKWVQKGSKIGQKPLKCHKTAFWSLTCTPIIRQNRGILTVRRVLRGVSRGSQGSSEGVFRGLRGVSQRSQRGLPRVPGGSPRVLRGS